MTDSARIRQLEERLDRLESEGAIRACINRYMFLCDYLDARTPLDELAGLFTAAAVWEGVGEKYAASFGRIDGRGVGRLQVAGDGAGQMGHGQNKKPLSRCAPSPKGDNAGGRRRSGHGVLEWPAPRPSAR